VSSLVKVNLHSKEFIPIFDEASKFTFSQNLNFLKVNCEHKNICQFYDVKRYPTIKVFYKGEELNDEPARDLNGLIEFAEKLSKNSIQELNQEQISKFVDMKPNELLLLYKNDSNTYRCLENLIESKFKLSYNVLSVLKSQENINLLKSIYPKFLFDEDEFIIV
jgi:hypothetical protein